MPPVADGYAHLAAIFAQADDIDRREGVLAYQRYNAVMQGLADLYATPLDRVVAAFVSLSPNSDYKGNLRSTATLLDGIRKGVPPENIVVTSFGHCKWRAYEYVTGTADFLTRTKGPKVRSFYHNILNPSDPEHVTVDGHMVAAWRAQDLTMQQALCGAREYRTIRDACKTLATVLGIVPCEFQATVWFARKRLKNIIYDAQFDMLQASDDVWRTLYDVKRIKLFAPLQPGAVGGRIIDNKTVACYQQGSLL